MSKAKLFTYVSLHDDEAIAIYEVNVATGQLAQRGHCQLHSSPSVLTANAADPLARWLRGKQADDTDAGRQSRLRFVFRFLQARNQGVRDFAGA